MKKINLIVVLMLIAVLSIGCVEQEQSIPTPTPTQLTDDVVEQKISDVLTRNGFNVKKIEVSGGTVWIDIYDIGAWPDYQKKQLVITLAKLSHQERSGSGGTVVRLYDEYGVKIASARYSLYGDVRNVELY